MLPEEPPEGCFWQTLGRPIDPVLLARIRVRGREALCEYLMSAGLNEQSRCKLLRAFFPMSFREFRALERRIVASAVEICTVYVALVGEGTAVWRPVRGERVAPGLFRLDGPVPLGETWEFGPGELVRCTTRIFSEGEARLVAFSRVPGPL